MNIARTALSGLNTWYKSTGRQPLILKGARQVGKTHLVKSFLETNKIKYHLLNFEKAPELKSAFMESPDPVQIIRNLEFTHQLKISPEDLIFFDEIQECPEAITALKYFAEDRPKQPVICAGSLLGVALSEASFPVGKVSYHWLGPLNFGEFLTGLGDDLGFSALIELKKTLHISESAHRHLWTQLKKFYATGGLPRAVTEFSTNQYNLGDAFRATREIQQNLLRDYLSDFSKHSASANALHIRSIFENIPLQLAKVEDGSSVKFKFSDVIKGKRGFAALRNPIEWLDKAGLVYRIPIANRAEQPLVAFCRENLFKLFIFDVGILGALLRLSPEAIYSQDFGMHKGYFAESLVLQGMIKNDLDKPFCWMEGQAEVEFLSVMGLEVFPIEVKSSLRSKAKSLASYINRYSPKLALKLTPNRPRFDKTTRVYELPLYLAWDLFGLPLHAKVIE